LELFEKGEELLFFHAEDEIIGKELERLKIPSEIRKWAQQHNLSSHPLVIQKLRFQCSKCNKSYDRPGKLLEHIKVKHRVEVELLQLIMLTHSVQIEVSFVLEFSLQRRQRKPLRVEFTGSGRGL
jgi:hypothetical protein